MAVQMQRRTRTESAERWAQALERALANWLEVFQVADTGERMVTSASQLDTLHRTDGRDCTCAAAVAGDPICQHRAVVRFVSGWLPEPSPAAPALLPVVVTPVRPCLWCRGSGRVPNDYDRQYAACSACEGIGTVPAPQPAEREQIAA
jgi:hypothetical protein